MLDAGEYRMHTDVLAQIAGIALSEVEGAAGTGVRPDHPEDLKKRKNLSKGIKAEVAEGRISFDLEVNLEYGRDFVELAGKIQARVKEMVEAMTGWEVSAVNVAVVGVNAL